MYKVIPVSYSLEANKENKVQNLRCVYVCTIEICSTVIYITQHQVVSPEIADLKTHKN